MRLFIAINFNNEIKNSLCNVIQGLKNYAVKGNFTRRENLHLTLVFIGETNKISNVKEAMDLVSFKSFQLKLGELGKFKRSNGNIYWVGVKSNNQLNEIYSTLYNELKKRGFNIEDREYKPHLTIGREVILNSDFDENKFLIPDISMKIKNISLMKSERINGKLTYTEIYAKELDK